MRLERLLDQNPSFRLLSVLKPHFPGSVHVNALGMAAASDLTLWNHARDAGLALLTKDSDFHHLSLLTGGPPKVIWLKIGNMSTGEIAELLESHILDMQSFLAESEAALYGIER